MKPTSSVVSESVQKDLHTHSYVPNTSITNTNVLKPTCVVSETQKQEHSSNTSYTVNTPITDVVTREVTYKDNDSLVTVLIDVKVCHVPVQAVLDTASQITVLSDTFFDSLSCKSMVNESVTLKGAGIEMSMSGKFEVFLSPLQVFIFFGTCM
jgi:hypothetical protein